MRILFRKKQTPLVTNIHTGVNVIYEPYDVNRNENFENTEYCKAENINLTEKDNTLNPQSLVVNPNLSTQSLTVNSNEQHKLMNDIKIDNEINQDHSCSNESSSCENENLSDCPNDEPLLDTSNCPSLQKSKVPKSVSSEVVENIGKSISKKNGLIKEAPRSINSKLPSFSAINDHQNKLLPRIKTERYNKGIEFINAIEKRYHLLSTERLKAAKDDIDEAIRSRKIFSVLGPYNRIRKALRTRGWIEKFDVNIGSFGQFTQDLNKSVRSINNTKVAQNSLLNDSTTLEDSEDGDSDDDMTAAANEEKQRIQPWEEDNGYYGMLSRMVRSELPRFIWSLRKSQVDFNNLQKDQMINHHSGAPFTTKVGLCRQLRQIRWFADCNADYFFPRCFIISEDEDRQCFINDFRLTACISIVKMIANLIPDVKEPDPVVNQFNSKTICDRKNVNEIVENNNTNDSVFVETENFSLTDSTTDATLSLLDTKISYKKLWNINFAPNDLSENFQIPDEIIEFSIFQCQNFLKIKFHDDLDKSNKQPLPSEYPWDKFLSWYYRIIKMPQLLKTTKYFASDCQYLCKLLKKYCPQFDMDGVRNVWIVKPGAKSRGRGILCLDRLDDILKIVQGSVFLAEARYVVQKYIEKPLLIYKTKFDIRQWFLVTDWAPLTVWWYQDCYLRFCSQEFTLDDFSESIHLCNNCIQHKYKNGLRSSKLPDENMWTWEQFLSWLTEQGQPNLWTEKIQPSMKSAVLNALLSSQESIEPRKNCFGLYGADFILTADDYRLWLIEINSSPCMSPSTSVTALYTANVLEDTLKVVLDRKYNRNSDTGRFELLYRQPFHNPSNLYTGVELYVTGSKIHRPQLENTNILRCFNKATLELNGQSLSTSEVNRISTVVKDKQNTTPISQSQVNLQTQKQIQTSNLCHGYANTPEIVKGITCSLPLIKCAKFSTYNQYINNQSPECTSNNDTMKHLQSIKQTNRTTRSKSCKSESRLKMNNGLTVFKSMTNIEHLTETESTVPLIKYNNENIDHCDDNRLKSSHLECHKKAPTRKTNLLRNSSIATNAKDLSTVNLNQSTLHLMNKGKLIQYTTYETCNQHTNLHSSHINNKNKNLHSSLLL
ncbi:Tubulin monoglycylase TTLL3, partial [Schistosoma japonicum]